MRRHLPSLIALECFEASARYLSFTRAGEELCLTQSAVSRQIKNLEQFLGVSLFTRTAQGVELTPQGLRYAADVRQVLDRAEAVTRKISSIQGKPLLVAVEPAIASRWLMPRLGGDRPPPVAIELNTDMERVYGDIHDYDVAIRFGSGNWPGLVSQLLMPETLLAVCAPKLLRETGGLPFPDYEEIVQLPLLHLASELPPLQIWLQAAGYSLQQIEQLPGQRLKYFQLQLEAALQGLGVAVMPSYFVRDELDKGALVRACARELQCDQAYYVVTPQEKADMDAVERCITWLLSGDAR